MRSAILLSVLVSIGAHAQEPPDHLEPEDGPFFGIPSFYNRSAVELLITKLPRHDDTRVFVIPSFTPEWAISLSSSDGALTVAHVKKAELNDHGKVRHVVTSVSITISPVVAERIAALINKHLDRVHYPQVWNMGTDGETYHFATIKRNVGIRYGKTWSPDGDSLATLVRLVQTLDQLASGSAEERTKTIEKIGVALSDAEKAAAQMR